MVNDPTSTTITTDDDASSREERHEFLAIEGNPIYFQEDWDTGIGGGLWSTGLAMAKYFQNHSLAVRANLKALQSIKGDGLSALELGSGNGFLSVCFAALARGIVKELVVTDMADHLPLMEKTVKENNHLVGDNAGNDVMCVTVMEHRWGEFQRQNNNEEYEKSLEQEMQEGTKKFDFIFGSDLAYRDYLHAPLIASLQQFSHQNTISLIGVTMNDTKPKFFTALIEAGFKYDRLADCLMEPEFRGTTFGLFAIQKR